MFESTTPRIDNPFTAISVTCARYFGSCETIVNSGSSGLKHASTRVTENDTTTLILAYTSTQHDAMMQNKVLNLLCLAFTDESTCKHVNFHQSHLASSSVGHDIDVLRHFIHFVL